MRVWTATRRYFAPYKDVEYKLHFLQLALIFSPFDCLGAKVILSSLNFPFPLPFVTYHSFFCFSSCSLFHSHSHTGVRGCDNNSHQVPFCCMIYLCSLVKFDLIVREQEKCKDALKRVGASLKDETGWCIVTRLKVNVVYSSQEWELVLADLLTSCYFFLKIDSFFKNFHFYHVGLGEKAAQWLPSILTSSLEWQKSLDKKRKGFSSATGFDVHTPEVHRKKGKFVICQVCINTHRHL